MVRAWCSGHQMLSTTTEMHLGIHTGRACARRVSPAAWENCGKLRDPCWRVLECNTAPGNSNQQPTCYEQEERKHHSGLEACTVRMPLPGDERIANLKRTPDVVHTRNFHCTSSCGTCLYPSTNHRTDLCRKNKRVPRSTPRRRSPPTHLRGQLSRQPLFLLVNYCCGCCLLCTYSTAYRRQEATRFHVRALHTTRGCSRQHLTSGAEQQTWASVIRGMRPKRTPHGVDLGRNPARLRREGRSVYSMA